MLEQKSARALTRLFTWIRERAASEADARPRRDAPPPPAPNAWRHTVLQRGTFAAGALILWTAGIEGRLVYLQVVAHDDLLARAERQQMRTIPAPAKRGEIVDRRGRVLAYSVDADSIYAVPTEIDRPDHAASALCAALDACSGHERQVIADRLSRQRPFVFVRRQVTQEEAHRVAALNLAGVGFVKENRRFYPKKELAAHVLGYVGIDSDGLNGIEATYDSQIRGRAGKVLIQTDARRRAFSRVERPPTAGASVELTIDEYLQHIVERELRVAVAENNAAGGSVIVMDPRTGEVLALANEPTFNPNAFARSSDGERRNRAVQDIYEPGSTFKIVTASAAFEEHVVTPEDPIDVSAGMIRFGARQIDDVHRYNVLSFADVLVKSSNVGAIKVGLQLGSDRLGRYVRRFGFGQVLSRDLPGASAGIVWDPARVNDSALASMSMGYQVGVTPMQMAIALSSVANGGELLEPHVVRAITRDGRRTEVAPRVIRRTISHSTSVQLTDIMEAVVERGTATRARIDGYAVAGKTGTSAKLVNGRYSKTDYNASFAGFLPARNPALTILVVIDSPHTRGYFGGAIAAPLFKRIGEEALRHLGIAPTFGAEAPLIAFRRAPGAEDAAPVPLPAAMGPVPVSVDTNADVMPELRGMSAREALRRLGPLGISARLRGDGFVVDQQPVPGTPLDQTAACILQLSRHLPLVPSVRPPAASPPSGQQQ